MNRIDLASAIDKYRPLGGPMLPSFPVAILDNNGEIKALWFNFWIDQFDDVLHICIDTIFVMDNNTKIKKMNADIKLKIKVTEYYEPPLSKQKYFSLLEKQFTNYNKDEMMKLLSQTEIKPLLIAYETAINYVT